MSNNREAALEASAKFLTQLILRFGKLDCIFRQANFNSAYECYLLFGNNDFNNNDVAIIVEFDDHGNGLYDVKKIHYSGHEEVLWVDGWIYEPIPEQVIEHFKKLFDGTL